MGRGGKRGSEAVGMVDLVAMASDVFNSLTQSLKKSLKSLLTFLIQVSELTLTEKREVGEGVVSPPCAHLYLNPQYPLLQP